MNPEQEKKLNEVHTAIVGNPKMGQDGIVPRLKKLEDYKQKDEKLKMKIAGGIIVGTPILAAFMEWLKGKLKGEY